MHAPLYDPGRGDASGPSGKPPYYSCIAVAFRLTHGVGLHEKIHFGAQ